VLAGVDLAVAAQLPPGAGVRFSLIEAREARRLLGERERGFARWAGRALDLRLVVDGVPFRVSIEERWA
jgi:allophanate hydrolase subunit 2